MSTFEVPWLGTRLGKHADHGDYDLITAYAVLYGAEMEDAFGATTRSAKD